jgi:hypothetical protein
MMVMTSTIGCKQNANFEGPRSLASRATVEEDEAQRRSLRDKENELGKCHAPALTNLRLTNLGDVAPERHHPRQHIHTLSANTILRM